MKEYLDFVEEHAAPKEITRGGTWSRLFGKSGGGKPGELNRDPLTVTIYARGQHHFDLVDLPGLTSWEPEATTILNDYVNAETIEHTFVMCCHVADAELSVRTHPTATAQLIKCSSPLVRFVVCGSLPLLINLLVNPTHCPVQNNYAFGELA